MCSERLAAVVTVVVIVIIIITQRRLMNILLFVETIQGPQDLVVQFLTSGMIVWGLFTVLLNPTMSFFLFTFPNSFGTLTVGLIFVHKSEAVLNCSSFREEQLAYKGSPKTYESQISKGGVFLTYMCPLGVSLKTNYKKEILMKLLYIFPNNFGSSLKYANVLPSFDHLSFTLMITALDSLLLVPGVREGKQRWSFISGLFTVGSVPYCLCTGKGSKIIIKENFPTVGAVTSFSDSQPFKQAS